MKKWKVVMGIAFVIFVSVVAFVGVYQKENGVWRNLVADYQYGMDVEGARELRFAVDDTEEEKYVYVDEQGNNKGEVWKDGSSVTQETEENSENAEETENVEEVPYAKETRKIKVNPDDKLTKENFEQAKKIIQKRLKEEELDEYNLRIDDVTGKLVIESENDDKTIHLVEQLVSKPGKFQIIDYQNGLVLMDNLAIKNASVVYSNQSNYNTYLQIEFNKEGAEKLKEISNKYVEIKDETEGEESEQTEENAEENSEEEKETEKKMVSIVFDDDTMMTTYFGEEMSSGLLQIAVGQERTNYEDFLEDYQSAQTLANMINSGVLPVTYALETDNFVKSEWIASKQNLEIALFVILVVVPAVAFIVKFKKNGSVAAILNMGYVAGFSLILKYTNVEMTINAIFAGMLMIVVNMAFLKMMVQQLETQTIKQAYAEVSKKFYFAMLPLAVTALVFAFVKNYAINSVGMVVFWALILNVLYNVVFTRTVLDRED